MECHKMNSQVTIRVSFNCLYSLVWPSKHSKWDTAHTYKTLTPNAYNPRYYNVIGVYINVEQVMLVYNQRRFKFTCILIKGFPIIKGIKLFFFKRLVSNLKLFFFKTLLDWVAVLGFRSSFSVHGFMDFCTLCTWLAFVIWVLCWLITKKIWVYMYSS